MGGAINRKQGVTVKQKSLTALMPPDDLLFFNLFADEILSVTMATNTAHGAAQSIQSCSLTRCQTRGLSGHVHDNKPDLYTAAMVLPPNVLPRLTSPRGGAQVSVESFSGTNMFVLQRNGKC